MQAVGGGLGDGGLGGGGLGEGGGGEGDGAAVGSARAAAGRVTRVPSLLKICEEIYASERTRSDLTLSI